VAQFEVGGNKPGVNGRIDIGRFPQPAVVVAQPLIIGPQPVYLRVPYGRRKHCRKDCHEYNGCGVPLYFFRHDWYEQNVRHSGQPQTGHKNGDQGPGKGKGHGKGNG